MLPQAQPRGGRRCRYLRSRYGRGGGSARRQGRGRGEAQPERFRAVEGFQVGRAGVGFSVGSRTSRVAHRVLRRRRGRIGDQPRHSLGRRRLKVPPPRQRIGPVRGSVRMRPVGQLLHPHGAPAHRGAQNVQESQEFHHHPSGVGEQHGASAAHHVPDAGVGSAHELLRSDRRRRPDQGEDIPVVLPGGRGPVPERLPGGGGRVEDGGGGSQIGRRLLGGEAERPREAAGQFRHQGGHGGADGRHRGGERVPEDEGLQAHVVADEIHRHLRHPDIEGVRRDRRGGRLWLRIRRRRRWRRRRGGRGRRERGGGRGTLHRYAGDVSREGPERGARRGQEGHRPRRRHPGHPGLVRRPPGRCPPPPRSPPRGSSRRNPVEPRGPGGHDERNRREEGEGG
mmetsp:Transcript_41100/g.124162  ORF Transcript_41100/g.124162 Transcript_41100/m.124162 type:complete len:396 (+) Transcript_41100:1214-2401(+)